MSRRRDVLLLGLAVAGLAAGVGGWLVPERWQQWVLVGVAAWLSLSVLVSLAVGKLIARRDEQVPVETDDLVEAPKPGPPAHVIRLLAESVEDTPPAGPRGDRGQR